MWWEDPTTKLDLATVRQKLMNNNDWKEKLAAMKNDEVDNKIKLTLEHLECVGMVNTPLLNPVQTKREYFWLFTIVVVENLIALGIELINGGVWTSQVSVEHVLSCVVLVRCVIISTDAHDAGSLLQLGHQAGITGTGSRVPDCLLSEVPRDT